MAVIGSGATAVTLVPEMAKRAAHVTMLQRSPTYIVSLPAEDVSCSLAASVAARASGAPAHPLEERAPDDVLLHARAATARVHEAKDPGSGSKSSLARTTTSQALHAHATTPGTSASASLRMATFFEAIRAGKASVVTDQIDTFTETGLQLRSGEQLDADIIVTATGLKLKVLGGIEIVVDGAPVDLAMALPTRA